MPACRPAQLSVPSGGASPLQFELITAAYNCLRNFPSPQAGRVLCNFPAKRPGRDCASLSVPSGGASPLQLGQTLSPYFPYNFLFPSPQAGRVLCNQMREFRSTLHLEAFRPLRRGESSATSSMASRLLALVRAFRPLRRGESSATYRSSISLSWCLSFPSPQAGRVLCNIPALASFLQEPDFPSPQAGRVLCNSISRLYMVCRMGLSVPSGGASPLQPTTWRMRYLCHASFPSPQAGRVLCNDTKISTIIICVPLSVPSGGASPLQLIILDEYGEFVGIFPSPQAGRVLCNSRCKWIDR